MKSLDMLWIDDEILAVKSAWEPSLRDLLLGQNIELRIEALSHGLGAMERIRERHFDLIVLDVRLEGDAHVPTGWHLLQRLRDARLSRAVVLFTAHVHDASSPSSGLGDGAFNQRGDLLAAFEKSPSGLAELAKFIKQFAETPPVTLVVMTDLHFGMSGSVVVRDALVKRVLEDLRSTREKWHPDHLVILGDVAWKGQADDLAFGVRFLERVRAQLDLRDEGALHICPGNHDVVLGSQHPWQAYRDLVGKLADSDGSITKRYSDGFGQLREFVAPEDLVAVARGRRPGVVFASLNSVDPEGHQQRITRLGSAQRDRLRYLLRELEVGHGALRIALMHHPLFPVPSDDELGAEDRILTDGARSFRDLHSLGFQLILNGHSHYSCVHEHRIAVLNERPGMGSVVRRLVVVSVATLGGQPSSATPYRQYAIIQIGHRKSNGTRDIHLRTRVYSSESEHFEDGDHAQLEIAESAAPHLDSG
jgi:CheY-like chemotaxis protein